MLSIRNINATIQISGFSTLSQFPQRVLGRLYAPMVIVYTLLGWTGLPEGDAQRQALFRGGPTDWIPRNYIYLLKN